jgi:3-deoxy-D-manno-octulosonate 8-phosphate phosphatase (KDO 8-P phosphatase)
VTANLRTLDAASLAKIIRNIRLVAFDFDGVFTDNTVYVFEDGREAVRCTRSDGIGLNKLRTLGIETIIISTEPNLVVSARSRKLNIECIQNCQDKLHALDQVVKKLGLTFKQVAFVGNDVNDLSCLTTVALPIVVSDAHPDVVSFAYYQTKLAGGRGAVREVCDLFDQVLS